MHFDIGKTSCVSCRGLTQNSGIWTLFCDEIQYTARRAPSSKIAISAKLEISAKCHLGFGLRHRLRRIRKIMNALCYFFNVYYFNRPLVKCRKKLGRVATVKRGVWRETKHFTHLNRFILSTVIIRLIIIRNL